MRSHLKTDVWKRRLAYILDRGITSCELLFFYPLNRPGFGGPSRCAHLVVTAIAALSTLLCSSRALESPYWCVSEGEMKQAFQSLCQTRRSRLIAARDLYQMYVFSMHGRHGYANANWCPQSTPRLSALLVTPNLKRTTVSSVTIMLTRILSCNRIVQDTLKEIVPADPIFQVYVRFYITIFTLLAILIPAALLDRVGRRPVLMGLMLLMFLLLQMPTFGFTGNMQIAIVVSSKFLFVVLYGAIEVIHTVYAAEAFPLYYRGKQFSILEPKKESSNMKGIEMGMAVTISIYHGILVLMEFAMPNLWRWMYFYPLTYYLVPCVSTC